MGTFLHLDQLDLLAVQLGHDLGPPLLRELGELFGDIDASISPPFAWGYTTSSNLPT
jgi:hypothetical protein